MNTTSSRTICLQCRYHLSKRPFRRSLHASTRLYAEKPPPATAPKQIIDVKHIRQNPEIHEKNCLERNYKVQSTYPSKILALFDKWQEQRQKGKELRERAKVLGSKISNADGAAHRELIRDEARKVKDNLSGIEKEELAINDEIQSLAAAIPNLTSGETPRGDESRTLGYINEHPDPTHDKSFDSHVAISKELDLIDFSSSGTVSGSGWYFLLNEAALLEQALIQYTLQKAMEYGFQLVSPPSLVYSHIASACGFQPRDVNNEQQIYHIKQSQKGFGKPRLSLAGTAEIPLAGMKANKVIHEEELPLKKVAVSRCYRAEAGSHGIDTKGLYRVHEFTKVELFAWTRPSLPWATSTFLEIVALQKCILESLNLHCRILEMSSTDLGASAYRKIDIETYFPSRRSRDWGWGEVTSTSICTDYQSRRLNTKCKLKESEGNEFPWTVNGTALAVPRVMAAILENGWDETRRVVRIPEVLRPWMGGAEVIGPKKGM